MHQSEIRSIGNKVALRNGLRFKNYLPKYILAFSLYLIGYIVTLLLLVIISFSPIIGFMWWTDFISNTMSKAYQFPTVIASLIIFIAILIFSVRKLYRTTKKVNVLERISKRVKILWVVICKMPQYVSLKEKIMDSYIKDFYTEIKEIEGKNIHK